ncbi:translation initiation factor IF-2-like [Panicum miliaceum]|uniref:Translation initiation factor IF-2-like n=1 Tax=Panicum miliaceum TaxID=4540 RepID=A0A3L6SCS2_PANMI|nr:translation initiation factor IF-2-like [Panicum miliaceum]
MKPGAVAASRSGGGTVAFSWEQEPGVSKRSPAEAVERTTGAPRAEAASRTTPAPAKKAPPPPAHRHRLRVPPPPGGPGAPAVSPPPGKSSISGSRSRRVRPRDDPFLAAYLACTDNSGSNSGKGPRKLLGWAGLGLGLGLGLRGLGLSCKNSCGAVECVVTLARIPELDED